MKLSSTVLLSGVVHLTAGFFFVATALYLFQSALIFPGSMMSVAQPAAERAAAELPSGVRNFFLRTSDGEFIEIWATKPPEQSEEQGVAVIFDGNASVLPASRIYSDYFASLGYRSFIFTYRGFGRSTGVPSETALRSDVRLFSRWLRAMHGGNGAKTVVVGVSIGGAPASYFASHYGADILVLLSSFTSVADIASAHPFYRFFRPLLRNPLPVLDTVKDLSSLQCVILSHGTADEVIPFAHFQRLRDELSPIHSVQTIVVDEGPHMLFHMIPEELRDMLSQCSH